MNLILTIIYVILLFVVTLYYFHRNNISDMGKILLFLYLTVGIFSVLYISRFGGTVQIEIDFIPYLFLIISYVIFFTPFFSNSIKNGLLSVSIQGNNYLVFSYVYILCTIISICCYINPVYELVLSGNWAINKAAHYASEIAYPYGNIVEWFSIQFSSYFRFVAISVSFALMRAGLKMRLASVMLILSELFFFLSAVFMSARGMMLNETLMFTAIVLTFSSQLPRNISKLLRFLVGILWGIGSLFGVVVSVSRFTNDGAMDSVINYFGQPPVFFNYGIWCVSEYSLGEYGFGRLFGVNQFNHTSVGSKIFGEFYTFVGWLFLDWGPIGTLLIGIIIVFFFRLQCRKKIWHVSDFYILLAYYYFLIEGVFVIGRSYCYYALSYVIVSLFLKYIVEKIPVVPRKVTIRNSI